MQNSDFQGEMGESRFKEICAHAGLICNKADRDRAGWDFVVDFDFPAREASVPLEERKAPLSCHVQLKTILDKNDTVKLRLSSAERLAKELKPSFIYVFKLDKDGAFTRAYLIHLRGEALGAILRRLRKDGLEGKTAINQAEISMSARKYGIEIEPTGQALRDEISKLCGNDLHAYASAKKTELDTLGFSERPYSMTLVMPGDWDEIVDVLLGNKPSGKVLQFNINETRFGIVRPIVTDGESAQFEFRPTAADQCVIVVRSEEFSEPAVFRGDVFAPGIPKLPKEHVRFLFKTDFFKLVMSDEKIDYESVDQIEPQEPSAWLKHFRVLLALATGSGSIQVSSTKHPMTTTLKIPQPNAEIDADECRQLIKVCERTRDVLKRVGVATEPKVDMNVILENADRILQLYSLLNPQEGPTETSFRSEYKAPFPESIESDMLYAGFFQLDKITIAYCGTMRAVANRSGDELLWRSDNINLISTREIQFFPRQYTELIDEMKRETGLQGVFSMTPPDETAGKQ